MAALCLKGKGGLRPQSFIEQLGHFTWWSDMPPASSNECGSNQATARYYAPLSSTCPTQIQTSVGICCIQCRAQ